MNLTDALKGWLVEHMGVAETASDEEFRDAAAKAIVEGKLSEEQLYRLNNPAAQTEDLAKTIQAAVTTSVAPLAEKVEATGERIEKVAADVEALKAPPKKEPDITEEMGKRVDALLEKHMGQFTQPKDSETTPAKMFGEGAETMPRVKPVKEMYSHTKSALEHPQYDRHGNPNPLAGRAALYGADLSNMGLPKGCAASPPMQLHTSSEWDLAVCGAYFKHAAQRGNLSGLPLPRKLQMTEHDRQILTAAAHEEKWTGYAEDSDHAAPIDNRKLTEFERKALIDDSTSGGLEAAPIVFDAAVITTPVLHGELFPLVSVVPLSRGRRVEGFSISNPTFTSGTAEGTAITLFTTDSMVSAFDTTIYNAVGAIEIGQDFEQDSPVNIGQLVTQLYGEKAKEWLDNQIANGDGTTEPEGLFNATGITDIGNPSGGANAAPQPDDYITLWGNVAKQFRPASDKMRCVFVGNDTSYRRARSIAVGAADERRVFGMNIGSYDIFEHPFKVQNDIANTVCGFFCMKYYRMYRRLGLNVRVETGGKELARANLTLIVVRMRWGGQLELGGAGSYSDNWQT